jgi:hypothetical protein
MPANVAYRIKFYNQQHRNYWCKTRFLELVLEIIKYANNSGASNLNVGDTKESGRDL